MITSKGDEEPPLWLRIFWALACGGVAGCRARGRADIERSEEHTSELQSLMRISYAVFCLKKKKTTNKSQKSTLPHHICKHLKHIHLLLYVVLLTLFNDR